MTWTSFSFAVGQILTAQNMNDLYANFTAVAHGDTGAPGLYVAAISSLNPTVDDLNNISRLRGGLWYNYIGSAQSIGTGAYTTIAFSYKSYLSNSSDIGFNIPGAITTLKVTSGSPNVQLYAELDFDNFSPGYWEFAVRKNGVDDPVMPRFRMDPSSWGAKNAVVSPVIQAASGDYFQVVAYQNSGSSKNVRGGYFGMVLVP